MLVRWRRFVAAHLSRRKLAAKMGTRVLRGRQGTSRGKRGFWVDWEGGWVRLASVPARDKRCHEWGTRGEGAQQRGGLARLKDIGECQGRRRRVGAVGPRR